MITPDEMEIEIRDPYSGGLKRISLIHNSSNNCLCIGRETIAYCDMAELIDLMRHYLKQNKEIKDV